MPCLKRFSQAQVFSKVGDVKRIVMGLDKHTLTPCGFCFVVYYTREDAEDCVKVPPPPPLFRPCVRKWCGLCICHKGHDTTRTPR